jgi:hypothetical protein
MPVHKNKKNNRFEFRVSDSILSDLDFLRCQFNLPDKTKTIEFLICQQVKKFKKQ